MKMKVKICGITTLEDVKQIQKLNYDNLGFINIERSKRFISENNIINLKNNILNKRGPTLVLEPDNPYEVILKINKLQIFNVQLHSLTPYDIKYIRWINQYHNLERINITKAIGLTDTVDNNKRKELENFATNCNNILLDYIKDGLTGGTNTQIPIDTAIEACKIIKNKNKFAEVTLAGGLNYKYLNSIYDKLHYFDKIDLNSGVENSPGNKNIKDIKKILSMFNE